MRYFYLQFRSLLDTQLRAYSRKLKPYQKYSITKQKYRRNAQAKSNKFTNTFHAKNTYIKKDTYMHN